LPQVGSVSNSSFFFEGPFLYNLATFPPLFRCLFRGVSFPSVFADSDRRNFVSNSRHPERAPARCGTDCFFTIFSSAVFFWFFFFFFFFFVGGVVFFFFFFFFFFWFSQFPSILKLDGPSGSRVGFLFLKRRIAPLNLLPPLADCFRLVIGGRKASGFDRLERFFRARGEIPFSFSSLVLFPSHVRAPIATRAGGENLLLDSRFFSPPVTMRGKKKILCFLSCPHLSPLLRSP